MNKELKILHVLWSSYPLLGGSCLRSKHIVDFQTQYCEPIVLSSPFSYDLNQLRLGARHISDGVLYLHSIDGSYIIPKHFVICPGIGPIVRRFHMWRFKRFINSIVKIISPNVIHAISPFPIGYPSLHVARAYSIPFIYEVRNFHEEGRVARGDIKDGGLRHKWNQYVEDNLMRQSDAVTTISKAMKKVIIMRGIPQDKIHVIPNGVDHNRFVFTEKDRETAKNLNLDGYVVLGMTSIKPLEGAEIAIKAMPKILSKYDKAKLLLICDWQNQREKLESLTIKFGLGDFVIFKDRVGYSEIPKYYSVMDVLLMPRVISKYNKASPLRPLEAMSMEKVVLGSNVGGLSEIIRDGVTGCLFEHGNIDDLARKCILLCKERDMRRKIGLEARIWVKRERTWSKMVNKYKDIYNSLVRGN